MKVTRRPFSENKLPSIGHRLNYRSNIRLSKDEFEELSSSVLRASCAHCVRQNPDNEIPIKKIVG